MCKPQHSGLGRSGEYLCPYQNEKAEKVKNEKSLLTKILLLFDIHLQFTHFVYSLLNKKLYKLEERHRKTKSKSPTLCLLTGLKDWEKRLIISDRAHIGKWWLKGEKIKMTA